MLYEYYFRVADFLFSVCLPADQPIERLLPSFYSFWCSREEGGEPLFRFAVMPDPDIAETGGTLLEESENDLGHTRLFRTADGYRIDIGHTGEGNVHRLYADAAFEFASARIRWDDPHLPEVLSSMIRILFSQSVIRFGGVSLHAAAVSLGGLAYLFMGKSGTGKSTHALLWQLCFPDCELLNDDNPVVRTVDGIPMVYGTPWSGKTPCYKDECFPVGGVVRLVQASFNRFSPKEGVEAFIALLPGCSVIREDASLHDRLCDTLVELTTKVPVGVLECLPNQDAARLCCRQLTRGRVDKEERIRRSLNYRPLTSAKPNSF